MDVSQDKDVVGAFNTKHPPSAHAMQCLGRIAAHGSNGMPAQEVNFTVRDKLLAFAYVERRMAPSNGWYKTHNEGQVVDFLFITQKGREALYQ